MEFIANRFSLWTKLYHTTDQWQELTLSMIIHIAFLDSTIWSRAYERHDNADIFLTVLHPKKIVSILIRDKCHVLNSNKLSKYSIRHVPLETHVSIGWTLVDLSIIKISSTNISCRYYFELIIWQWTSTLHKWLSSLFVYRTNTELNSIVLYSLVIDRSCSRWHL
jgi:hypothetical protein